MDKRQRAHEILRKALDEAGIIDGFVCGVMLDSKDVATFRVGIPERECYENVERFHRLVGLIETNKISMMNSFISSMRLNKDTTELEEGE